MTTEVSTLNIEKLADRDDHLNMAVYGEAGVGKTVFASGAPGPILWLEAEGGTASIARDERAKIDIVRMTNLESYREVLSHLLANPDAYGTLVIDSLTESQAILLKEIMGHVVAQDPSRDRYAPFYDEWGRLAGVMRDIIRGFRDLPMHTVFTALTREDTDEMTGLTKVGMRLQPAVSFEMPGYMDVVGYMYTATVKSGEVGTEGAGEAEEGEEVIVRNMLIKPSGKYTAKIRVPADEETPDFVREPTWEKVARLSGAIE